ncbi:developmentally-regulated protein [Acrasis kona]|uniref:Developmentally-regulated protein n=1 Tax=Acrasis kona TaxID=1008807 RepID=A0AAW2YZ57_9EUKA
MSILYRRKSSTAKSQTLPTPAVNLGGDAQDNYLPTYDSLPNEIWLLVLEFLDTLTLSHTQRVNKRFNALSSYDPLWKGLYKKHFVPWRVELNIKHYQQLLLMLPYNNHESQPAGYYGQRKGRRRSKSNNQLTWKHVLAVRYQIEKEHLSRTVLQDVISDARSSLEVNHRPALCNLIEKMNDQGDILINAARACDPSSDKHLWLRAFSIELYEACMTLIPKEWRSQPELIPIISDTLPDMPRNLDEYAQKYPPFWRTVHNISVAIMDVHCFIVKTNDCIDKTCQKVKILIDEFVLPFEHVVEFERCFPSPVANWARMFLDCGSDMMQHDAELSCSLLSKSLILFDQEFSISRARNIAIDYDAYYSQADALARLAAVKTFSPEKSYFDQMNQLLDSCCAAWTECCRIKPNDFITLYRAGLAELRRVSLCVLKSEHLMDVDQVALKKKRSHHVNTSCEYMSKCVGVQDYYRARETWGTILFDEAERENRDWLKNRDSALFVSQGNQLYDNLQKAIDQFVHAKRVMSNTFGSVNQSRHYCDADIACAASLQLEIRIRIQHTFRNEELELMELIKTTKGGVAGEHRRKLKSKQDQLKNLKKDVSRLHYKAMTAFDAIRDKRLGFSLFHEARIKCMMGDENQSRRLLYSILELKDDHDDCFLEGWNICRDSAFESVHDKAWFVKFVEKLGKRARRVAGRSDCE